MKFLLWFALLGQLLSTVLADPTTVRKLFASVNSANDYYADWSAQRTLSNAFAVDPENNRMVMRGSGELRFGGGELRMEGNPRAYVSGSWRNVEMTMYGQVLNYDNQAFSSTSGFTMVTRSSHNLYKDDPCEAHGYYMRLYFQTGELSFQKEFSHSDTTVYTPSVRLKSTLIPKTSYENKWLGLKFLVRDNPDQKSVHLEIYMDETEGANGGTWVLMHSLDDVDWSTSKSLSCVYPYTPAGLNHDQAPVLRTGEVSFLRTDSINSNGIKWKDVSIREIAPITDPSQTNPPTNPPTNPVTIPPTAPPTNPPDAANANCELGIRGSKDSCCLLSCGTCGGSGCSGRVGGSEGCCTSDINALLRSCDSHPAPCTVGLASDVSDVTAPPSPITTPPSPPRNNTPTVVLVLVASGMFCAATVLLIKLKAKSSSKGMLPYSNMDKGRKQTRKHQHQQPY